MLLHLFLTTIFLTHILIPTVTRTAHYEASEIHYGTTKTVQKYPNKGIVKYYSPGMMRRVAHNRRMEMREDVDGYASTTNCRNIGKVLWASINEGPWESYQILDCSAPRDRNRHYRESLILEVDYSSAVRNEFDDDGRASVRVFCGGCIR